MIARSAGASAPASMHGSARCAGALLLICAVAGCDVTELPPPAPTYADVAPVLRAACVECHGEDRAEADYRVDWYLDAIACPRGQGQAVEPRDVRAPILAVLDRPDHAGLLTDQDAALLRAWVESGALSRVGEAHASGWVDPRSADFHGRALRAEGYGRLIDPTTPGACARCHLGTDGTIDPMAPTAPGATACTSCHTEPGGPTACSTCHGDEDHAYPPRDLCFFPDQAGTAGAHEAHAAGNIDCALCHGERTVASLGTSLHGNGVVEIDARAGFDPGTRTCANRCHDRGGTMPMPSWLPHVGVDCSSCHQSPPPDHFAGTCDRCHAEVVPTGDALIPGPLHGNGVVDLGDGSGGCGACHGEGDDPTPTTGAHPSHAHPTLARPFGCENCHVVPSTVLDPGHIDHPTGAAEVVFGALASARGASPTLSADGTCSSVACHGSGLGGGTVDAPRWDDESGVAARCGACHSIPPPPPHTSSASCNATTCHGGYVAPGPLLTTEGIAVHVNGTIDLWASP